MSRSGGPAGRLRPWTCCAPPTGGSARCPASTFRRAPDDPATEANRAAWAALGRWDRPFLLPFSDSDPITGGMRPILERHVPGARDLDHPVITG
jgi:haloalkane dehalogenase